jgi:hypothetical protein
LHAPPSHVDPPLLLPEPVLEPPSEPDPEPELDPDPEPELAPLPASLGDPPCVPWEAQAPPRASAVQPIATSPANEVWTERMSYN